MDAAEFKGLGAFVAIVEHGSFTRAARHIRLSASALSQVIRELEARYGTRLLNRTTRSVAPTAAGQRLYDRLRPAFQELDAAVAEAKSLGVEPGGQIRINLPRSAVLGVIAPILGSFNREFPNVVLDLVVQETLVDIVVERFDAGIRLGASVEKDMVSVRISDDVELVAVASPEYLARRGLPNSPADLEVHDCITWRWPTAGSTFSWPFEMDGVKHDVAVAGPIIAYDFDIQLEAALQGVGIIYAHNPRIADLIAKGLLVRLLEPWSLRMTGFHLYYPDHRYLHPALQVFVEFLAGCHSE